MASNPQPPAPPARPAQPAQPARPQSSPPHGDAPTTIIAPDLHPPQKFKRPLPQPGDSDYVAGQPVDEEEANRVEKEDQERYDRGQASMKAATRSKENEKD